MINKVFLYSHGGSGNHGCEALARTTRNIIGTTVKTIYSFNVDEDKKYGLDEKVNILNGNNQNITFFERAKASLNIRLFHNDRYAEYINMKHQIEKDSIAVSIGGDNYCYAGFEEYCFKNRMFNKYGTKTALWGCSIEPNMVNDLMKEDLARYSFISARESITFDAIKEYNSNAYLFPDPAFTLEKDDCELPKIFKNKIVGINLSPVVITSATEDSIVLKNYINMVKYIIDNTDYSVALIPHVVWSTNDDRKAMQPLLDEFADTNRVVMIDDRNCMQLKYAISKCELFIGARTHSTIAAYSTLVPTLVIGYSVKAKGIAKDLFGTYENYVLPVQSLKNEDDMINAFKWLDSNKENIKNHLAEIMPGYVEKAFSAGDKFREVFGIE